MKNFVLIFLLIFVFTNCKTVQTQQISNTQPTPTQANVSDGGYEIGYPKFTTTNKQYLGCWRSTKASEVVQYKLEFFQITEKTVQTSKMPKPVSYSEIESNSYKDWFVLQTESKNNKLQPYLNINMVSSDEMTMGEYSAKHLDADKQKDYWNLKRENCDKILKKFSDK